MVNMPSQLVISVARDELALTSEYIQALLPSGEDCLTETGSHSSALQSHLAQRISVRYAREQSSQF